MSELSFAGRVAIVTGAGGALGRAYALLLASRGASVLVNDLGVPMQGGGSSSAPADKVVAEIIAAGGKAKADSHDVLDGDKIVQAALDAFGRVDIVINNAGILRDVSFLRMSQDQWDIIHRVHVEGAYKVTKAAWPHMLKQKYGRIIMTSSGAGLYGNHGQANYSAAKLGLVGLSNTLAKEGAKNNVLCNVIAPIAGSRLTETVMPPDLVAALDPTYVAPIVAYLCHESSTQNGCIYETGAGYCAQVHWQRSAGVHFPLKDGSFTPEAIASQWDKVNSFDEGATYPTGLNDTMGVIMSQLGGGRSTNLGLGKPNNKAPSQLASNAANGSDKAAAASSSTAAPAFASDKVFDWLRSVVTTDPTIAQKVNANFTYHLSTPTAKKVMTISIKKNGTAAVYEGPVKEGKTDVTVTISDADYCALAEDKATSQMLYMKGRLKMQGNLATAMKFDGIIKALRAQLKAKL